MLSRASFRGFSLVELIVVIATIGLMVALLFPAIQAVRESARHAQCTNNLKQIGVACLNCEASILHFPAGGWAAFWAPDPDRGTGVRQPGGPIYNMLPYMEKTPLYDLQKYLTGSERAAAAKEQLGSVLPVFTCPSRRSPQAYPQQNGTYDTTGELINNTRYLSDQELSGIEYVGRSDYAGNGYHFFGFDYAGVTESDVLSAEGESPHWGTGGTGTTGIDLIFNNDAKRIAMLFALLSGDATNGSWGYSFPIYGIFSPCSTTTIGQIKDGTSHTYLFGEKYICPEYYFSGLQHGDCYDMYGGSGPDILRYSANHGCWNTVFAFAYRDTPGYLPNASWGSAHVSGFNMVFCDGSVHTISYGISSTIHDQLGDRRDGATIDSLILDSS